VNCRKTKVCFYYVDLQPIPCNRGKGSETKVHKSNLMSERLATFREYNFSVLEVDEIVRALLKNKEVSRNTSLVHFLLDLKSKVSNV